MHSTFAVMLNCSDYRFICEFKIKGQEKQVIGEFKVHMNEEHGIDYSAKVLQQMVIRKDQSKLLKNK